MKETWKITYTDGTAEEFEVSGFVELFFELHQWSSDGLVKIVKIEKTS